MIKKSILLLIIIVIVSINLNARQYKCKWFNLDYPKNWKLSGDYNKKGVIHIYPKTEFGETDALISIWSMGKKESIKDAKKTVFQFIGFKHKKYYIIEKQISTNINNIDVEYIQYKTDREVTMGKVESWFYNKAYYLIHRYQKQGILIQASCINDIFCYSLDVIINSIEWNNLKKEKIKKELKKSKKIGTGTITSSTSYTSE